MISCGYDSNDKSQYDYLSDYEKVLKTAKLLNLTIENCEDLAALIHMDLKRTQVPFNRSPINIWAAI